MGTFTPGTGTYKKDADIAVQGKVEKVFGNLPGALMLLPNGGAIAEGMPVFQKADGTVTANPTEASLFCGFVQRSDDGDDTDADAIKALKSVMWAGGIWTVWGGAALNTITEIPAKLYFMADGKLGTAGTLAPGLFIANDGQWKDEKNGLVKVHLRSMFTMTPAENAEKEGA
jgi:hypothetical protein